MVQFYLEVRVPLLGSSSQRVRFCANPSTQKSTVMLVSASRQYHDPIQVQYSLRNLNNVHGNALDHALDSSCKSLNRESSGMVEFKVEIIV